MAGPQPRFEKVSAPPPEGGAANSPHGMPAPAGQDVPYQPIKAPWHVRHARLVATSSVAVIAIGAAALLAYEVWLTRSLDQVMRARDAVIQAAPAAIAPAETIRAPAEPQRAQPPVAARATPAPTPAARKSTVPAPVAVPSSGPRPPAVTHTRPEAAAGAGAAAGTAAAPVAATPAPAAPASAPANCPEAVVALGLCPAK